MSTKETFARVTMTLNGPRWYLTKQGLLTDDVAEAGVWTTVDAVTVREAQKDRRWPAAASWRVELVVEG